MTMKRFESGHYYFCYHENSRAEQDLAVIAEEQEACFRYICDVLNVQPDFKLTYFLCDSPEEVGAFYGDNEPCNGFARVPDKIYAVYNEKVKCIGFHEDAHLISYLINRPDCPAVREGLAMYFDSKWWGISNRDWAGYFLKTGRYIGIGELLNEDRFFAADCSITYPIMGAFTAWLISVYGMDRYLAFYKTQNPVTGFAEIYGKSSEILNDEFVSYVRLFRNDRVLETRMEELLLN